MARSLLPYVPRVTVVVVLPEIRIDPHELPLHVTLADEPPDELELPDEPLDEPPD